MKKGIDYIGVGSGAMVFKDGKVLLAKRGPKAQNEVGKWEFPGGGVQFGETCEEAIIREVYEEFAIKINITKFLNFVDHILPEEGQHWVSPSFIAEYVSGTPKIMEPEKIDKFTWSAIEDIDPELLTKASQKTLEGYMPLLTNATAS